MQYKLNLFFNGRNEFVDIINSDLKIKDLLFVEGFGLLYLHGNCIGLLDKNNNLIENWFCSNKEEILCSLCYDVVLEIIYVMSSLGNIYKKTKGNETFISFLNNYPSRVIGEIVQNNSFFDFSIQNFKRKELIVLIHNNARCYKVSSNKIHLIAGSDYFNSALGKSSLCTSLGSPKDIAFCNQQLYVLDSCFCCIKRFKDFQNKKGFSNVEYFCNIDHLKGFHYMNNKNNFSINEQSKIDFYKDRLFLLCDKKIFSSHFNTCDFSLFFSSNKKIDLFKIDTYGRLWFVELLNE